MSTKTLKIGFAMGGGVSLGTFSGAALSEAIRQIVLYGNYDKIVVDVFAGASAGSMSLAIMLRGLAYQTKKEKEEAEVKLRNELTNAVFEGLSDDKKKDIIAAQVVQDLQHEIWVKKINILKLLGLDENGKNVVDLTFEPGLVSRMALTDIAEEYFDFKLEQENQIGFTSKRLLADRVLFGSTLTNLSPIQNDSRRGKPAYDETYTPSADAFTSRTHREMRIFDLNFTPIDAKLVKDERYYPKKWIRYYSGGKQDGTYGDLNEKAGWSKIVSTSVACGAFPFAFEPVVLKRYDYEFSERQWADIKDVAIRSENGKHYWFPFSYVDGGTMNNEPVREAFRLAAFQDAGDISDFERVVIFVDPNVGEEAIDYRVAIHKRHAFDKSPERLPTRNRLFAHAGSMLGVLTEQVRNNEYDKIDDTMELFKDRAKYCEPIFTMIDQLPEAIVINQLARIRMHVEEVLNNEQQNELLPVGAITLDEELIKIRREHLDHLQLITIEEINLFYNDGTHEFPLNKKRAFLKALYAIEVSILVGLGGKSPEYKIVAIAPVIRDEHGNEEKLDLPGSYIAAFAGFFSEVPNEYEVKLAKYCARDYVKRAQLIPKTAPGDIVRPPFTDEEKKQYGKDFQRNIKHVRERIAEVMVGDHPFLEWILKHFKKLGLGLEDIKLEPDPKVSIYIQIPVTGKDFMLKGDHKSKAILIDGTLYCITEATLHLNTNKWDGEHVQPARDLSLCHDNILNNPEICRIEMPDKSLVTKARFYPNPIFILRNPVSENSKGIKAGEWTILSGVTPLEDTLLC